MSKEIASSPSRRTLISLGGGAVAATALTGSANADVPTGAHGAVQAGQTTTGIEQTSGMEKLDRSANLSDLQDRTEGLANLDLIPAGEGAIARSVPLVLNDWSNSVASYGAAGDGATDDTLAFINAMSAYPGRQVFVPPDRTYVVGAVGGLGPAGAGLVGIAGYNTVICPRRNFTGAMFYNPHAGSTGSAYGLIRDLRIDLRGENCTAIDLSHCDTWVIDRVNGRGGASRLGAAGVFVRFGAPSNSSSYNNVVRDCGGEYFDRAIVFGTNANQNRIEGGTFTNNREAVDCAPPGGLSRPQILGARLEGNDVGIREGAQGGVYLVYCEDHAIGDFSFTRDSDGAVILPGTTSASTRTPLHGRAEARNLRCLSFDLGYYDSEEHPSRPAFEQRRQVRTAPGAAVEPKYPAGEFTDLFMQSVWLGHSVNIEAVNAAGDGTVVVMRGNADDEIEIMGFDRGRQRFGDVNIGGGAAINPLGDGLTSLGKDSRRFRAANLSEGVLVAGNQVVGAQGPAIDDATDSEHAVQQLNALLASLRAHGLIAR